MQGDGPTLPNLPTDVSGATRESGGAPAWPVANRHNQSPSARYVNPTVLGFSLGANVALLIGLLGLLLLARAGIFSPARPSPTLSASAPALSSPTPASSTTPTSGWLQVLPASVHLGCDNGQQTQFVVLENTGPEQVQWQANFSGSGSADQAGVEVSPNQGTLDAGTSMPIQLHNRTHGADSQGTISFDPDTPDAGPSPSLTYTAAGCGD
jgi:hypothetical protein